MDFSRTITDRYHTHKRDLPWRETSDPYRIWLSEIIMQQTRVDQGLPYYLRFVEAFPSVEDLAAADEDQVMRLWQGLGYYSRARNMHATARYVRQEWGTIFPSAYSVLIGLKGIGAYTAAAVASFAGNRSEEHTSELQSLMRISYAVFCLKKKNAQYTLILIMYFLI